jgi:hypothetical protein
MVGLVRAEGDAASLGARDVETWTSVAEARLASNVDVALESATHKALFIATYEAFLFATHKSLVPFFPN